jgi:catechol 2,3-dioxygenase
MVEAPGSGPELFATLACTNLDHDLGLSIDTAPGSGRLNHLAWVFESREAVLLTVDAIVEAGLPIELGPTRHSIGDIFFLYVHDPGSGHRVEFYSSGYLNFEPDRPTIKWSVTETPHPLLAWGGEIPPGLRGMLPQRFGTQ